MYVANLTLCLCIPLIYFIKGNRKSFWYIVGMLEFVHNYKKAETSTNETTDATCLARVPYTYGILTRL